MHDIEVALDAARGFAIGLQHDALAASHGRIDALVRALVRDVTGAASAGATADAAGASSTADDAPSAARSGELAQVRRSIERHQQLLCSLHDAVQATLKHASHTPPVGYGHGAQMQGGGARPLLMTCA